jgi:hypothetical protein
MFFDTTGLPSADEIWGWHEELRKMGTRYTGSQGQADFVAWLRQQFEANPQKKKMKLYTDSIYFHRWLAKPNGWSLSMQKDPTGPAVPMPVSYYYPYSGNTGLKGPINARLVDLGSYAPGGPFSWEAAKGAIALVRVPPSVFSLDVGQLPTDGFRPGQPSLETVVDYEAQALVVTNPVFQGMLAPVPLLAARQAGVLGVICVWTGMSDDQIANQYNPFTTGYPNKTGLPDKNDPGCPALWVGEKTGERLAEAVKTGQPTVTLTLDAEITPNATTDTLWGVLEGSGPDHERGLIVNTHTDGPNVPEDNGALALLALARYFAPRPHRRDLYFVMATGHFQLPQFMQPVANPRFVAGNDAASLWMAQYPHIYTKALAGITIEHLGCKMWTDNANGQYVPTGAYEWGTTYTTQKDGSLNLGNLEQQAFLAAVAAANNSGAVAHPVVTMLPAPLFFGEGAPLYAGGLGTVSMCPAPSYLLQAGSLAQPYLLNLDKLDKDLIWGQVLTFAMTIATLDEAEASAF